MDAMEILDETIEYYRTHKRGMVSLDDLAGAVVGRCVYINGAGDMCAVGRCCADVDMVQSTVGIGSFMDIMEHFPDWDTVLMDEYKGQSAAFWDSLQSLHDRDAHWTEAPGGGGSVLTENGQKFVERMREDIILERS